MPLFLQKQTGPVFGGQFNIVSQTGQGNAIIMVFPPGFEVIAS